jgi:hypothetical protein
MSDIPVTRISDLGCNLPEMRIRNNILSHEEIYKLKEEYIRSSYICDCDDDDRLGFSKGIDEDFEMMIDY